MYDDLSYNIYFINNEDETNRRKTVFISKVHWKELVVDAVAVNRFFDSFPEPQIANNCISSRSGDPSSTGRSDHRTHFTGRINDHSRRHAGDRALTYFYFYLFIFLLLFTINFFTNLPGTIKFAGLGGTPKSFVMLGEPKSSISSLKMTPVCSEANFAPKLNANLSSQDDLKV